MVRACGDECVTMAARGDHLELEIAVGAPEAGAVEMPSADPSGTHVDPLGAEVEVTRVIGGSKARLRTARGCLWSRTG